VTYTFFVKQNFYIFVRVVGILIFGLALPSPSGADTEDGGLTTFSFYLENDYFVGDDSQYTNGLKFAWSSPVYTGYPKKTWPHRWFYPVVRLLPFDDFFDSHLEKNITLSFGQNIYTPEDIEEEDLIEDDRPYAGITYLSMGFHSRLKSQQKTLELYIGLVGPQSYAEQCQQFVHEIVRDIEPMGWDNQLKNEPVLGVVYEHKMKVMQLGDGNGFGFDGIVNNGIGLGNANTYYNLGLNLRMGYNIPNDFGSFPIRPAPSMNTAFGSRDPRYSIKHPFGIYLFTSAEGQAVLRNIFLDGNTFTDSHSVEKELLVADLAAGIGILVGKAQFCFAYVYRTREFETQERAQEFGSLSFSISY
jgi:lipid A 3-O-deacylase